MCVHVSLGNNIFSLTRLLKHITGQKEQPSVQQQQMHPQKSHLMLFRNVKKKAMIVLKYHEKSKKTKKFGDGGSYFNGRDFFRILFTRPTVALNSSGATRDCRAAGKFVLKLLLNPKLIDKNQK